MTRISMAIKIDFAFRPIFFQMVRHGGCLGVGLAAMGTARQGKEYQEGMFLAENINVINCNKIRKANKVKYLWRYLSI